MIDLTNGATSAFPPRLAQGLEHGSADERADMELSGGGYGIHWPRLDADLTVPGLLNGVFGTAKWMAALAGTPQSPAKPPLPAATAPRVGGPGKLLHDPARHLCLQYVRQLLIQPGGLPIVGYQ